MVAVPVVPHYFDAITFQLDLACLMVVAEDGKFLLWREITLIVFQRELWKSSKQVTHQEVHPKTNGFLRICAVADFFFVSHPLWLACFSIQ